MANALPNHETTRATPAAPLLGKLAYGALFVLVVPAVLVGWARATAGVVPLPPLQSAPIGAGLVVAGLALIAAGAWALRVFGGGVPMNAYPPPRFVERGVYGLVPHPIYVGFCGVVLGVSLFVGSASGVYLVAPFAALGCAALVLGYERHDLERRFGKAHPRTRIALPEATEAPPSVMDRASVVVLVLVPFAAIREAVAHLGRLLEARSSSVLDVTVYIAIAAATLFASSRGALRQLAVRGLYAMVVGFALCLAFPVAPSFVVVWAALAASLLARTWPRAKLLLYAWLAAVVVTEAVRGERATTEVLAALVIALGAVRAPTVWEALRRTSERIANSWHEWTIGPVRIINHGAYAALGTAVAAAITGTLAGPGSATATVMGALVALVLAGLWAQVIEGSPQLLRPYGFYGGVLGIIAGSLVAPLFGKSTWLMLAAFATSGPFIQSIGRLRCLVQGCCHGAPAPEAIGIRYTHPRSRVCRIAHLVGVPVHPTPLYSILWNVVVALVMGTLWSLHASLQLIGGLYLVLTGVGRFVEEAYRGEPQTKIVLGLRLYQWIAIVTVVIGIVVTSLGGEGRAPQPVLTWPPMVAALVAGVICGVAMGFDFPASRRRFSRLA